MFKMQVTIIPIKNIKELSYAAIKAKFRDSKDIIIFKYNSQRVLYNLKTKLTYNWNDFIIYCILFFVKICLMSYHIL